MSEAPPPEPAAPTLVRGLGAWDVWLLTIGSILGTGIFITTGSIARELPHPGLILLVWVVGGLLTIAGALTYAELGAMFPRAGGQYQFLKEAYGPVWGFLFGWTAFLVIMCGGIATLAVGFGEYLGAYIPFFSTTHVMAAIPVGPWIWSINGGQVGGALAVAFLTAVNYVGLKEGARVQNVVTIAKIGSIVGIALFGLFAPAAGVPSLTTSLPSGNLLGAVGVAMIAVVWSYDGWYAATNVASEMRRPERDLPLGLIGGTIGVMVLYVLMNVAYLRALSVEQMAATGRIGEAAATALFGPLGGRLITAAVLLSTFGAISSTILYSARVYFPMAEDGLFFSAIARIHPRYRTPSASIVAQGAWSIALTFSGTYEQLYTYVVFAIVLFHAATGAAVFVLRRTRPDAPRPYRAWGYPVVPAVFILTCLALVANTLVETPKESLIGLVLMLAGLPAYFAWRKRR